MAIMAKKFPRDETAAFARIMQACKRPSLAEKALYAYPRGGQTVTGPSIRLLEAVARAWGNVLCGTKEITQTSKAEILSPDKPGESQMLAYAWDIETNYRDQREFVVPHLRDKKGGNALLTDARDVYEITANMAARRKRACLMAIIPGDILEAAVEACSKTLEAGDGQVPLADRIRQMVVAFTELGVNQAMLEGRLRHKIEATIPAELVNLKAIYTSLRDGASKREDWFELGPGQSGEAPSAQAEALTEKLKKAKTETPPKA